MSDLPTSLSLLVSTLLKIKTTFQSGIKNQSQSLLIFHVKHLIVFSDPSKAGEGKGYGWMPVPCTDDYANFCVHGQCEFNYGVASCRSASHVNHFSCLLKFYIFCFCAIFVFLHSQVWFGLHRNAVWWDRRLQHLVCGPQWSETSLRAHSCYHWSRADRHHRGRCHVHY